MHWKTLVIRLADRRAGRTEANVQSDLHMLLAAAAHTRGDGSSDLVGLHQGQGRKHYQRDRCDQVADVDASHGDREHPHQLDEDEVLGKYRMEHPDADRLPAVAFWQDDRGRLFFLMDASHPRCFPATNS
jgi:hypothetical protein